MRKLLGLLAFTLTTGNAHAALAVKSGYIDLERPVFAIHARCVRGHEYLFQALPISFPVADATIAVGSPSRHTIAYAEGLAYFGYTRLNFVATVTGDYTFLVGIEGGQPGTVQLAVYDLAVENARAQRCERRQQAAESVRQQHAAKVEARLAVEEKRREEREAREAAAEHVKVRAAMAERVRQEQLQWAAEQRAERERLDREEDGTPQPRDGGPPASEKQVPAQ